MSSPILHSKENNDNIRTGTLGLRSLRVALCLHWLSKAEHWGTPNDSDKVVGSV